MAKSKPNSKAKPKYSHPVGGWSSPIEYSDKQRKIVTGICNDPGFLDAVAEIVGDYNCNRKMYEKIPSVAEDLATLEDLSKSIFDLKQKLSKLSAGRVNARLYKVSGDIRTAQESLQKIYIETIFALQKHPEPRAGRHPDYARMEAARSFKRLFDCHDIQWTASIHEGREPGKYKVSFAIQILTNFLDMAPETARGYINDNIKSEK
jgi:hypothetical protein